MKDGYSYLCFDKSPLLVRSFISQLLTVVIIWEIKTGLNVKTEGQLTEKQY